MPKAFTHLCKKVNLSLYDNTLTVYPKTNLLENFPPVKDQLTQIFLMLFIQMDCVNAEVDQFFIERSNELGVYRFVHRDDPDHYLYHQDNFKMDDNHYHAQFQITIDEHKLDSILTTLQKYSIITDTEHASFVKAYHAANTLPEVQELSKQVDAKVDPEVAKLSKTENNESTAPQDVSEKPARTTTSDSKTTFAGLKRGFFNQKPSTNVSHDTAKFTMWY